MPALPEAPDHRPHPGGGQRPGVLLVLVLGVLLGWLIRSARVQREAVAAIERAGGQVTYDWSWDYDVAMETPRPASRWRPWLAAHLGPDYVGNVVRVTLAGGPITPAADAPLAEVGRLGRLE